MIPFVPSHYRIRIRPDLANCTFSGRVEIEGFLARETDLVELHSRELEIVECALGGLAGTPCRWVADAEERLWVTLPQPTQGPITLGLAYRGMINDQMVGFYRSRFRSAEETGVLALTQFQESDARRAIPCIDQPDAKAVFEVELELSGAMAALSNTPVKEELSLQDDRRVVRFQPTPKMSTYLLFFAVGPFARRVGSRFGLDPCRRANILDATVCTWPFLLPYCIPTILAAGASASGEAAGMPRISPLQAGLYNFHSWALLAVVVVAILTGYGRQRRSTQQEADT